MEAITKEQLEQTLKDIDSAHKLKRSQALAQYARSNDIVVDGDLVTDHINTIKVHARKVCYERDTACMGYHGVRCKKDGTPFKSGEYIWVYQRNIEKINGVEIKK